MGEEGGFQSDERVQGFQQDVDENLEWLLEALRQEQQRRDQEQQQGEPQDQPPGENRLVPDSAELKLLRRLEIEVQEAVERLLLIYPELETMEVDELVLEDVMRLAHRHERVTELFSALRERLGVPAPDAEGHDGSGHGAEDDLPDRGRGEDGR